jgi:hypothetical protein
MKNLFSSVNRKSVSKNHIKRSTTLQFENMEDRCVMMAAGLINTAGYNNGGAIYDPGLNDLVLAPPSSEANFNVNPSTKLLSITTLETYDDDVKVTIHNNNTTSTADDLVRVSVKNIGDLLVQDFPLASINSISFQGLSGHDRFENLTHLPSTAYGGTGNDTLLGGSAVDQFFGGDGYDYLDGRLGNDILYGEGQQDRIFGDAGNDYINGGADLDMLYGGLGDDTMYGEEGNDWIDGGTGGNKMYGGIGADKFYNFPATKKVPKGFAHDLNTKQGDTSSAANEPTFGWFDANMVDPGLRSQVKLSYRDIGITRPDMFDIYNQVKVDGTVSTGELADLRKLAAPSTNVGMPEDVRVLAGKVASANAANAKFQGQALGNLAAGNNGAKLDKLVNKWFRGWDVPVAATGTMYIGMQGSLFQNGISYTDVDQNRGNDCYFLAALGEVALKSPSTIQNMFVDNRDGTYTVRLFNGTAADYVTVNTALPVYAAPSQSNYGTVYYAGVGGGTYWSSSNELWVALAEKAYAQMNESGWIGQDNTNTYVGIDFGFAELALKHVTGKATSSFAISTITQAVIVNNFNVGNGVTLSSKASGLMSNLVANHSYVMLGFDTATNTFRLYNPWGSDAPASGKATIVNLTMAQLNANFTHVQFATMI